MATPKEVPTWPYLAGILDGEGYFSILHWKARNIYRAVVGVTTTSKMLTDWLESNVGGTTTEHFIPPELNWKTKYQWRLRTREIEGILKLVLPFLVIKRKQAEIILAFRASMTRHKVTSERFNFRSDLRDNLRVLNAKGKTSRDYPLAGVGPSGPKRTASLVDEDIVPPAAKVAAVIN